MSERTGAELLAEAVRVRETLGDASAQAYLDSLTSDEQLRMAEAMGPEWQRVDDALGDLRETALASTLEMAQAMARIAAGMVKMLEDLAMIFRDEPGDTGEQSCPGTGKR